LGKREPQQEELQQAALDAALRAAS